MWHAPLANVSKWTSMNFILLGVCDIFRKYYFKKTNKLRSFPVKLKKKSIISTRNDHKKWNLICKQRQRHSPMCFFNNCLKRLFTFLVHSQEATLRKEKPAPRSHSGVNPRRFDQSLARSSHGIKNPFNSGLI
jgi:hypothetical protein